MNAVLLPVLSLAVGALLGLLSTLLVSVVRQRQDVRLRLLDRFLEARRETVDAVCDLSHFPGSGALSEVDRAALRDGVARLFYRHYDFLPRGVLQALLLLQVSLDRFDGRLYAVRDDAVLVLSRDEAAAFIGRCCPLRNARLFSSWVLGGSASGRRAQLATALHARNVLNALNEVASPGHLLGIPSRLRKTLPL